MIKQNSLLLVGAAIAFAAVARAADPPAALPAFTNPGFANPDTPGLMDGKPAGDVPNTVDMLVLKQLAIGGQAEVSLGKMGRERGAAGVKDFGARMVDDHTAANSKLASVARS